MPNILYWDSMTSAEIELLAQRDPVAILPIASIEQHGSHLPVSTDKDIGKGLLQHAFQYLPDNFPACVLTPLNLGTSPEHHLFPGTVSLEPKILEAVIESYGLALSQCGIRRLLLSNSHGGNRAALESIALKLRKTYDLLVIKINYFLFPRPEDVKIPESEWQYGLHGGAVETSLMLHLHPDRVRAGEMMELKDTTSLLENLDQTLERITATNDAASFAWLAGDLNKHGILGNPSLATSEIGMKLAKHYSQLIAETIRDTKRFPINRLGVS